MGQEPIFCRAGLEGGVSRQWFLFGIFFFFSVQWIRTISLWVALSMVPIAPKPSGPMKTRPDSWKKKSCWDSDWFCLGWAHPCDHQPPQHCQKTLKKNIFLKIARDSPHVWEWWLLRGSETQFKV